MIDRLSSSVYLGLAHFPGVNPATAMIMGGGSSGGTPVLLVSNLNQEVSRVEICIIWSGEEKVGQYDSMFQAHLQHVFVALCIAVPLVKHVNVAQRCFFSLPVVWG